MKLSSFVPDSLKNAIFEEDPAAPPSASIPVPSTAPMPDGFLDHPVPDSTPIVSPDLGLDTAGDGSNPFLVSLTAKTDFDQTSIGKSLAEHMAPLADLPLTDSQKVIAAVKSGAKDGLSGASILSSLEDLKSLLQKEQAAFDSAIAGAVASEIETRKQKIGDENTKQSDLQAQITACQQLQTQLSNEIIDITAKIEKKKVQFLTAINSRTSFVTTVISRFQNIFNTPKVGI